MSFFKNTTFKMDTRLLTYPAANLSIYSPGFVGKCIISYYNHPKNVHGLQFYIHDIDQATNVKLRDELLSPLDEFPCTGEVFAIDLKENGLHRVVYDDVNKSLLFIDWGGIMNVAFKSRPEIYSISKLALQRPARAIPCQIIEILDESENPIEDFAKVMHVQLWFIVDRIERGMLCVSLYKAMPKEILLPNEVRENYCFSKEELEMLYEEPEMVTTNALKAVLGFVPQDERRVCPFYVPGRNGCFKGNSCRLEHVALMKDGTTRDHNRAQIKLPAEHMPAVGSRVDVCITCVVSGNEFYINIPEVSAHSKPGSLKELQKEINETVYVNQYKQIRGIPDMGEFVLIRRGGNYYRGEIIEQFDDNFSVFFVDYGFTELLHIGDIYVWHPRWSFIPAQAHRCFFEDINVFDSSEIQAISAFQNMIRPGGVTAKILSYTGDLHVQLFDIKDKNIGNVLCMRGFAERKLKLVPITTQIPG